MKNKQIEQVSVDEQERILIPSSLQNKLGLMPGMTLVVEKEEEGRTYLRIQRETETALLVEKEGILVAKTQSLDKLTNITRDERDCRTQSLLEQLEL